MLDLLRKVPLYKYGGIFVDQDIIFIKNILNTLGNSSIISALNTNEINEIKNNWNKSDIEF